MKKRILLVENDVVLAVLTKLELEDLGYEVLEIASTGAMIRIPLNTSLPR